MKVPVFRKHCCECTKDRSGDHNSYIKSRIDYMASKVNSGYRSHNETVDYMQKVLAENELLKERLEEVESQLDMKNKIKYDLNEDIDRLIKEKEKEDNVKGKNITFNYLILHKSKLDINKYYKIF